MPDGAFSYTWDAEGRQTGTSGTICGTASYVYDGDGRRVKKTVGSTTTLFWPDLGSNVLTETDGAGSLVKDYIYFAGRRLAYLYSSSAKFYFGGQIGTGSVITFDNGTICYDADFYPFGGERTPYVNTCPPSNYGQNYKFAGMERDSETQNDHTMFRYYASNYGRWLSPDLLGGDLNNPQSLNRYAHVRNNPTNLVDPLGLCSQPPPRSDLEWNADCIHYHQITCHDKNCADEHYGGEMFVGFATQSSPMMICFDGHVLKICGTTVGPGIDEFDGVLGNAGLSPGAYYIPGGYAQTNSHGRTSTGTGTFGFNDQLWSLATDTSRAVLPEIVANSQDDYLKAVMNRDRQIQDLLTGNYVFGPSIGTADRQGPGLSAFGVLDKVTGFAPIPNSPGNQVTVTQPVWVPLPFLGR